MQNRRTNRLLLLFHYWRFSDLISMEGLDEFFEFYTPLRTIFHHRTYSRDLRFLQEAGLLHLKYSRKERGYVDCDGGDDILPSFPENKTQRKYMEKIIRLCTIMTELFPEEVADPIAWYRERYPNLSERTRQRDFKKLKEIGYVLSYISIAEMGEEGGEYCYRYPGGAYDIEVLMVEQRSALARK